MQSGIQIDNERRSKCMDEPFFEAQMKKGEAVK
jgi:hypothetical protein